MKNQPEAQKAQRPVVQIEVRNVYGNVLNYPVNDAAKLFAQIAYKVTLDRKDLQAIKALGFDIEQIVKPIDLSDEILIAA